MKKKWLIILLTISLCASVGFNIYQHINPQVIIVEKQIQGYFTITNGSSVPIDIPVDPSNFCEGK